MTASCFSQDGFSTLYSIPSELGYGTCERFSTRMWCYFETCQGCNASVLVSVPHFSQLASVSFWLNFIYQETVARKCRCECTAWYHAYYLPVDRLISLSPYSDWFSVVPLSQADLSWYLVSAEARCGSSRYVDMLNRRRTDILIFVIVAEMELLKVGVDQ